MNGVRGVRSILIVAGYADSLVNFRGDLIRALLKKEIRVMAAAPGLAGDVKSVLESWGCECHELGIARTGVNPAKDLLVVWQLLGLMRRCRPDMVLAYTIKPVVYGMVAAALARVPARFALVTGLGYAFQGGDGRALIRLIAKILYRVSLAFTHKVFFQNPDDEALFRDSGVLSASVPSRVLNGSGIDVDRFAFTQSPAQGPVFLLIARLLGDKGVREYVTAARQIKARFPCARFQVAGWIDSSPDAIDAAELDAWIREGTVEYLGKLDDVRPAIADSTVYVLPSYREGTPRTVLEAMAMGRAVITTDAPGCRETVVDGDNGFLVPVKSVGALEQAMLKFIETPSLAVRMGARGRQLAEEKYDVHKVNSVMLREMGIQ